LTKYNVLLASYPLYLSDLDLMTSFSSSNWKGKQISEHAREIESAAQVRRVAEVPQQMAGLPESLFHYEETTLKGINLINTSDF
jgi:hypothetical protein